MNRRLGTNGVAFNSLILTFVSVLTSVIGIVVTKLLSVYFSLEEYGTYSQANLVCTTVTSLSILGLTNATNYFYNRTDDLATQKIYISTIFIVELLIGSVSGVGVILLSPVIASAFGNAGLIAMLPIVAFTPLLTNILAMYQTLFVSIGKAKILAVRNLIVSVLRLVTVIAIVLYIKNIAFVLLFVLMLDLLQVLYFAWMFRKNKFPISPRNADFGLLREIFAFSIPMAVYVLTNSLSRDIDKYVISFFCDTETIAVYANASKLLPFDLLTTSLITVLVPVLTRLINSKQFEDAQKVMKLYLQMGYVMTFIFVGGAVALAKDLLLFLYDPKYLSGLAIFIVYLFVDMIRFANVTTILSAAGKTKILMRISVSVLVANAFLNVLALKLFGIIGPAVTTLVLTLLMIMAMLHYGASEIHSSVLELFDYRDMAIIGVEILLFGFAAGRLCSMLEVAGISIFFRLAICYGSYAAAMLLINKTRIINCFRKLNQYK